MIRIFRKIRASLLFNSRIKKYLLYALGEIILVMIGILLALQVNTWNEHRKQKQTEKILLTSLLEDLDNNIQSLKDLLEFESTIYTSNKVVLNVLNDDQSVFHDSLSTYIGKAQTSGGFNPISLSYESIKSIGLNIISNLEVRNQIVKLYENDYTSSEHINDALGDLYIELSGFFHKYFFTGENAFIKIPNDFENLKTNNEYKNILSSKAAYMKAVISFHENILENTKAVKETVNNEINTISH